MSLLCVDYPFIRIVVSRYSQKGFFEFLSVSTDSSAGELVESRRNSGFIVLLTQVESADLLILQRKHHWQPITEDTYWWP